MRRVCVIQARTGSRRLPGKVLMNVGDRPLLSLMLDRLAPLPVDVIVVATSTKSGDDAVAELAQQHGAEVVRGDELDVLSRFELALRRQPADVVIRLTADCPFIDWRVIAEGIDAQQRSRADHVSNVLVRTYPDGLDFEVVTASALQAASREATDLVEREHVTPYIFSRPERFCLETVRHAESFAHERWTVDTMEDLEFVRKTVTSLADPVGADWLTIRSVTATGQPPTHTIRPLNRHDRFVAEGTPVDDPGRRVFVAELQGEPMAWVQVNVRAGEGVCTAGWVNRRSRDDEFAATTMRHVLAAIIPQVRRLHSDRSSIPTEFFAYLQARSDETAVDQIVVSLSA